MTYLLFLLFSGIYLSVLRQCRPVSYRSLLLFGLPFIIMWALLIGGQYNVGTDYVDYLHTFLTGDTRYIEENRGEFLFSGIMSSLWDAGIRGQGIFIAYSLIWVLALLRIMHLCVGSRWLYLFLFVFIVFPGMFNNQMNGLRQYTAVYVLTLGAFFFADRRYKLAAALFVSAPFFHSSAALIIPLLAVMYLLAGRCRPAWLAASIFAGIAVSFLTTPELVMKLLLLNPAGEMYVHYMESGLFVPHPLSVKLPKYICLPLYLAAIYIFTKKSPLDGRDRRLFALGVLAYAVKLATLSYGMMHRIGMYFDILTCVPLVYLLIWLYRNKRSVHYAVMAYMLAPFAVKVLVSTSGEYSYDNFLLHL